MFWKKREQPIPPELLALQRKAQEVEAMLAKAAAAPEMKIFKEIAIELARAEDKHPDWPTDLVRAALILVGEFGEMLKELQKYEETGDPQRLKNARVEAIQTAAMTFRLLLNWPEGK